MENAIAIDISTGYYTLCAFAVLCILLLRWVRHAQKDQSRENKQQETPDST